jgi:hypothetical protein
MHIAYAISSALFAAIFLVGVMVFGGEWARNCAIASAFLACACQFMAQDEASYKASIYSAYAAFIAALLAFLWLMMGW